MKTRLILMSMLSILIKSVSAQTSLVSGRVTDTNGTPIVGVTVMNEETRLTKFTDDDGDFQIDAAPGQHLVFTFVGAQQKVISVTNNDPIHVQLDINLNLEEVVVTGYQAERKKDLTGAVSVVDIGEMNKQAVGNPMKALQGQVPGVYITSNGSPRGAATVRIRGIGTLNDNNPLYIIDGVPTKSGLHTINQRDIESMQILKDASASSIYGSRAANGVIIITTKKGKKGGTQVEFDTYLSASDYLSKVDMLDTDGYGRSLWQAYVNAGSDPNSTSLPFEFEYHTDPSTGRAVLDNIITPEFLDPDQTLRTANTNWFNEIARTGIIQNYDLAISKGSEVGSSLFSVGYFDNQGIIRETGFSRISLRFNSEYRLFGDNLTIGENFNIVHLDEVGAVPINEAIQAVPMIPVHTADGLGWGGPWGGMNDRQNPVRVIQDNKQNNDLYVRMLGNFYAEARLFDGLTVKTNFGLDYGQDYRRNWLKSYRSGYLENPLNRVNMNQWHDVKTTWTNTINYNKTFNDIHSIDVFGGMEVFQSNYSTFWASREDYVVENEEFMYLDSGTGLKDNGGSGAKYALLSYFGKATYNLSGKYLASVTLRHDGSSRFGKNNRFGTFPAFSLGWQLGEERIIKNLQIFDNLKVRYGWGITGNQEIDNHAIFNIYNAAYNSTSYDIGGQETGLLPSGYLMTQTENPNLRWESTTQSNIGIDFSVKNQLVYGSVDYYTKKTEDILLAPAYIAVLGEGGRRWVNGASMQNKGVEVALGNHTAVNEDLSLTFNLNLDFVRNKVTHLPEEVVNSYGGDSRIGQNILGRTLGTYYGYIADGLFQSAEEVETHAAQTGKGVGRIRYRDLNNDDVINDYDRTWIGTPLPDFTYGFSAALQYKNVDFSVFFQGLEGIDINNEVKRWTDFWSVTNAGSNKGTRLLDAWTPENNGSTIPAVSLTDVNNEARFSTYFVEDGSYLKIRNVQLGYTMNPSFHLGKASLRSFRVYINADNLVLLRKGGTFTGLDPENPAMGYPNPLVLTAGINLKF